MSAPSYLVCATERSGSTLLCELLAGTGVAGRPEDDERDVPGAELLHLLGQEVGRHQQDADRTAVQHALHPAGVRLLPVAGARDHHADAAAPRDSQVFLLVGAAVLVPMILAYSGYAYWVFRGKVQHDAGYH